MEISKEKAALPKTSKTSDAKREKGNLIIEHTIACFLVIHPIAHVTTVILQEQSTLTMSSISFPLASKTKLLILHAHTQNVVLQK
jgi:hypothetical protein